MQFAVTPTTVTDANGNDLWTTSITGEITVRKATAVDGGFIDGDVLENIPVPSEALTGLQLVAFTL